MSEAALVGGLVLAFAGGWCLRALRSAEDREALDNLERSLPFWHAALARANEEIERLRLEVAYWRGERQP